MDVRSLPPFTKFQTDVAAAHPDMAFTTDFLEQIYRLAEERLANEQESKRQTEAAVEIRRMISRSRAQLKNLRALKSRFEDARTQLEEVGFRSSKFRRLCDSIQNGIRSLMELLVMAQQSGIEQVFPTKAHGLGPRKWVTFSFYGLPQLGDRAVYSWFVLSSDKLLVDWCKANQKKLKKCEEWTILQTFLHKLFKEEGVQVEAIERLVRDTPKRAGRKRAGASTKANF